MLQWSSISIYVEFLIRSQIMYLCSCHINLHASLWSATRRSSSIHLLFTNDEYLIRFLLPYICNPKWYLWFLFATFFISLSILSFEIISRLWYFIYSYTFALSLYDMDMNTLSTLTLSINDDGLSRVSG